MTVDGDDLECVHGVARVWHSRFGPVATALMIDVGTEMITPVAFGVLAASSPPERLGQVMGAAEIGREVDEAGGPLLIGALAAAAGLAVLASESSCRASSFRVLTHR